MMLTTDGLMAGLLAVISHLLLTSEKHAVDSMSLGMCIL